MLKRLLLSSLLLSLLSVPVCADLVGDLDAVDDSYATSENVELVIDGKDGVLKNDSNFTKAAKVVFEETSANGGTVTGNDDGSFSYKPPADTTGADSFKYTLEEAGSKDETTVTIKIYGRLAGLGWVFMIASIAGVWLLAIFCYKKLLFED